MKFGNRSKENISKCHGDLQLIANEAIKITTVDFAVVQGHRSIEEQFELFKKGREYVGDKWVIVDPSRVVTNVDGYNKRSNHNYLPAQAFDVCGWVNGRPDWSERVLCYIGGVITSTANLLFDEGEIETRIRWGGDWDGDGVIITDQSFVDLPHFEILNKD